LLEMPACCDGRSLSQMRFTESSLVARVSAAHGQNGLATAGISLGLNCGELFWQHPIESSSNFTTPFRKGRSRETIAGPAV
jgi:hypothetical protein